MRFLLQNAHDLCGKIQLILQWYSENLSGIMRPGYEAGLSIPSNAEV
jgi:hypothetical protein